MNKQSKAERVFSKNLDRLLAGKKVKTTNGDIKATLDFAAKIAVLKPALSTQFKNRLKADLLKKIIVPEPVIKKSSWYSRILLSTAWKVAAIFTIILVISLVWRAGVFNLSPSNQQTTPPQATVTVKPTTTGAPATFYAVGNLLGYQVNTNKTVYQPGEQVVINLTLKNTSSGLLSLEKLPPIISIMNSGTGKPVYTFSGGMATHSLASGETLQLSYIWKQTDFNGRAVAGKYYLELEDLQYQDQTLQFQPQPVHFEIKPATTN